MNTARQTYLDSLRGLAALVVVSVHYAAAFYPYSVFGPQHGYRPVSPVEAWFWNPPLGLATAGQFAVSLFFILSGYVLSYGFLGQPGNRIRVVSAIAKRPWRLGALAWSSVIVSAVLWHLQLYANHEVAGLISGNHWFDSFWSGRADFGLLLYNLVVFPFASGKIYNTPLWTIQIELYGSIMVFAFLLIFGDRRYRLAVAAAVAVWFHDSMYLGFWLGLITADLVKHEHPALQTLSGRYAAALLWAGFLFLSSYPHNVTPAQLDAGVYGFLPRGDGAGNFYPMLAALCLFLLAVSSDGLKRFLTRPPLLFLGGISYALYVVHFLVLGTLSATLFVFLYDHIGHHGAFLSAAAAGIPVSIALSMVASRFIDEPAIRLSNRIARGVSGLLRSIGFGPVRQPSDRI